MPKVYLPLGSQLAYGALGEIAVFQGESARAYVVPRDPRTDAQLNTRHYFHDINRMIKAGGTWARAAFRTNWGSRWLAILYGICKRDDFGFWSAADALFQSFTDPQQAAWDAAAPFQVTYNEPGRIWYNIHMVVWQYEQNFGMFQFELDEVYGDDSATALAWWTKTLDGVPIAGVYDDNASFATYSGSVSVVSNPLAYGGSYHKLNAPFGPACYFYFVGNKLTLKFMKQPGNGTLSIKFDGQPYIFVSQADTATLWQQEWTSEDITKGLHFVIINRSGIGDCNLDAFTITAKTTRSKKSDLSAVVVGGGLYNQGEIDFGTIPTFSLVATIADVNVVRGQKVSVYQSADAATGRTSDENEMDPLLLRGFANDGNLTVYATALNGPVVGKFLVNYLVG